MEEPDYPYPIQNDNTKLKWIIPIGLFIIVLVSVVVFFTKLQKKPETKKSTAVVYKQLSNTPTQKPKKEKKDVTIQVLNGTGVSGQAGVIVKALEAAGYSPDHIKSGNAETIDHTVTTITANADFEDVVINIKDILRQSVPELTDGIPNTNPNIDSGFDVVIITGSKKITSVNPVSITNTPTQSITAHPASTPTPAQ
jgi:hypothetical protein